MVILLAVLPLGVSAQEIKAESVLKAREAALAAGDADAGLTLFADGSLAKSRSGAGYETRSTVVSGRRQGKNFQHHLHSRVGSKTSGRAWSGELTLSLRPFH